MPPERRLRRLALAGLAVAVVSAPARAEDGAASPPPAHATRDLATPAARETRLGEQAETARASARWRLAALYRLTVAPAPLAPASRARAVDAAARAFARAFAEERALAEESARARDERRALASASADEPPIGAAPALAAPVPGAVLARFGVAPDRDTGLSVSRAGLRLSAATGQDVRAPAAGTVAAIEDDREGGAVVLDHGAGWTSIVAGLGTVAVAAGAPVAAGRTLGAAAGGAGGVTFELWRGGRPVDPLLFFRSSGARRPAPRLTERLAAPASLP